MEKEDSRCVLTMPLSPEPWQSDIIEKRFRIMEQIENSLIALELRKLKNIERTREYKSIIARIKVEKDQKERNKLFKERNKILRDAGISWQSFVTDVSSLQKHFAPHIAQKVGAFAARSHVWRSFEKVAFGSGQKVHFHRRGDLKSISSGVFGASMTLKDGFLVWSGGTKDEKNRKIDPITIKVRVQKPETYYEKEMLQKQIKYLTIVRKWVKNRYRYYVQFMLVGTPATKPRPIANGKRVGIDIGPSSVAIASDKEVKLVELADRVQKNHDKKIRIQRSMDRSRRAMNPQNFNTDGTIKRGTKLVWTESKHYREMRGQVREFERKNADIRKYQHTCLANDILALGTDVYIEKMSFKGLQRKAKETTYREDGRAKSKKRFGKSIANRAPASFMTILNNKLSGIAGEELHEVNTFTFKASQYDHTSKTYKKKLLRDRWAMLSNGDKIQRDLYSAFLIMNSDAEMQHTNQARCEETYRKFKEKHDKLLVSMQEAGKEYPKSFGIKYCANVAHT